MTYIGMIFQYSQENSSGLIMLSDGKQKIFTNDEWIDSSNEASIGQKIAYIVDGDTVKIKVADSEDIQRSLSSEVDEKSVGDHLKHFTSIGFKLIKEVQNDGARTLLLRSFANGESEEVIIEESATKISIVQTINGKEI